MGRYIERLNSDLLETARRLLLTTEKSVGDVAAEVGIPNANYFSRLFKTNMGITPMRFRACRGDLGALKEGRG